MKKFQKTLNLAFEVIVQSPKHTFEIAPFFPILEQCVPLCSIKLQKTLILTFDAISTYLRKLHFFRIFAA